MIALVASKLKYMVFIDMQSRIYAVSQITSVIYQ